MNEDPLISVITVNKDNLSGLTRTIRSFKEQKFSKKELVVIDGNSSDGSFTFLRELEINSNFIHISEQDDGVYDGMNKGVLLAKGELLIFLNSGDCFSSDDILQIVADSYLKEDWAWGYGLAKSLDDSEQPQIYSFVPFSRGRLLLGVGTIPHQAAVFKKELFESLGGYNNISILSADQQLMARASLTEKPRIWLKFFADFEGNGLGSTRKPWHYPHEMYKFRKDNQQYLTNLAITDLGLTMIVILSRSFLFYQKNIRKTLKLLKLRRRCK